MIKMMIIDKFVINTNQNNKNNNKIIKINKIKK